MRFYMAPMEGITSYAFRNTLNSLFPGAVKYFSPFIVPDSMGRFKAGSLRDILPENNRGIKLVPQILTNQAQAFIAAAERLEDMGYEEINLNAGCPSGTVVPKHKGAGMLSDLHSLDDFLADIFSACHTRISIKTRLGIESSEEFPAILEVYNKYPIYELTVHARCRSGMYKSPVDYAAFRKAGENTSIPLCYNGNIFSQAEYSELLSAAESKAVMVGRGAAANPALIRQLGGGAALKETELYEFLRTLEEGLSSSGLGEHFVLARLKELWYYMQDMFPGAAKEIKNLKRAKYLSDYNAALSLLFSSGCFSPDSKFRS